MNSQNIYNNLCEDRKSRDAQYKPGSGLHRHHIIPKHSGGTDNKENYTYLTVREHIIAHYLLWRIYKNPNDLRSMQMLGANLSVEYRRQIGIFCRDHNIGFFSYSKEVQSEWSKKGAANSPVFQYWCSEEGLKERGRMGGLIGHLNSPEFQYWCSEEGLKERASLGGASHKGKKCMYKKGDTTFIRVPIDEVDDKLKKGYLLGSPIKPNKGKKFGPSKKRKAVTDGTRIFNSLAKASEEYSVSSAQICYWLKSPKFKDWAYV